MIAPITGDAKHLEVALDLAQTVLALPVVVPWYANMARAALALGSVHLSDVPKAREQYAALDSLPSYLIHYIVSDRILGLLAHTLGFFDQAVTHFQDALAFCNKAGYRPELAWTCHDYASTLLQSGDPGDRSQAMLLLEESLTISRDLEMRPLMERVAQCLEFAKIVPGQVPAYPDGLTRREVEVLGLIASGKSNNEIAEELMLSVRTVERHITGIYTKVRARNRADATAYAFGHNLTT